MKIGGAKPESARVRIMRLKSLIKASMTDGMRIFTYEAKNRMVPLILAALAFLSIFGYATATTAALKMSGDEVMILALFAFLTAILTVSEGVYKSGSLLFNCRDNDMLMAMPLTKAEIVFLRVFKFYIFELIYNTLFLAPAILAYIIHASVGVEFYLVAITMIFLLPVIPIGISSIIGAISSALASKFKKKNTMQILFTFLFLFIIIGATSQASRFVENDGGSTVLAGTAVMGFYYPARAFVELATDFSFLSFLKFVLINLGVFTTTVWLISRYYFRIVSRVNISSLGDKHKKLIFTRRGITRSIIRKEIRKYFSTPVLVSNTAFGLLLFLIGIGAICLKFDEIAGMLIQKEFPFTIDEMYKLAPLVGFCMMAFSSLMTFITTTMFSLERKAFNLLKILPVRPERIIFSKVFAAMTLIVPILLIGDLAIVIRFNATAIETLLILVGSFLLPLVTEMIGILIDLRFAKFNMDSDAEIVKQTVGVMISSFLGLFMTIASISFTVGLAILFGQVIGMAATLGLYLMIAICLIITLLKKGGKLFYRLSA